MGSTKSESSPAHASCRSGCLYSVSAGSARHRRDPYAIAVVPWVTYWISDQWNASFDTCIINRRYIRPLLPGLLAAYGTWWVGFALKTGAQHEPQKRRWQAPVQLSPTARSHHLPLAPRWEQRHAIPILCVRSQKMRDYPGLLSRAEKTAARVMNTLAAKTPSLLTRGI